MASTPLAFAMSTAFPSLVASVLVMPKREGIAALRFFSASRLVRVRLRLRLRLS